MGKRTRGQPTDLFYRFGTIYHFKFVAVFLTASLQSTAREESKPREETRQVWSMMHQYGLCLGARDSVVVSTYFVIVL